MVMEFCPGRSERAISLRWYPMALIAAVTRSAVSSRTVPMPLTTRETVTTATPARSATSRIVGLVFWRCGGRLLTWWEEQLYMVRRGRDCPQDNCCPGPPAPGQPSGCSWKDVLADRCGVRVLRV